MVKAGQGGVTPPAWLPLPSPAPSPTPWPSPGDFTGAEKKTLGEETTKHRRASAVEHLLQAPTQRTGREGQWGGELKTTLRE